MVQKSRVDTKIRDRAKTSAFFCQSRDIKPAEAHLDFVQP